MPRPISAARTVCGASASPLTVTRSWSTVALAMPGRRSRSAGSIGSDGTKVIVWLPPEVASYSGVPVATIRPSSTMYTRSHR